MNFTDVVPEDQDFGLNGGRKSQNGGWVIEVVGGDAAKSERGRVKAMVTNYRGECYSGLSSNELVYMRDSKDV